jgi:hypothetical protein
MIVEKVLSMWRTCLRPVSRLPTFDLFQNEKQEKAMSKFHDYLLASSRSTQTPYSYLYKVVNDYLVTEQGHQEERGKNN